MAVVIPSTGRTHTVRRAPVLAVLLVLLLASPFCLAGNRDLMFWAPYAPGSPEQAAEFLEEFARWVETAAGWPERSMSVIFRNTLEGGLEALEELGPGFAMVPVPVYLRYEESQGWQALRTMTLPGVAAQRYTLFGPPGSSLDWLQEPTTIEGNIVYDPQFVRSLGLAEAGGIQRAELEPTAQALATAWRAAQGEKVLVLLDEAQRRTMERYPDLQEKLVPLAESSLMPTALLVRRAGTTDADADGLTRALDRLGSDPGSAELRKRMQIQDFGMLDEDQLEMLARKYASAAKEPAAKGSSRSRE